MRGVRRRVLLSGFSPLRRWSRSPSGSARRRWRSPVLAAIALAEHNADPGHLVGRPPAREHRRRGPGPAARRGRRAGRDL